MVEQRSRCLDLSLRHRFTLPQGDVPLSSLSRMNWLIHLLLLLTPLPVLQVLLPCGVIRLSLDADLLGI
jgi:hypothetical protein